MIKILNLTNDRYKEWDDFCLKNDDAWFWHVTPVLDYCVAYGLNTFETLNCSFYLQDDIGILAVCPLCLEKKNGPEGVCHCEFGVSGNGNFTIVPALRNDLSEERREKVLKIIFGHIDKLAIELSAAKISCRMSPLSGRNSYNWLLRYGFIDTSTNTQVIDLSDLLENIWSLLRKGHKYDVNRGRKSFDIRIYSQENISQEIFDQYRLLHHKAAGRVTRPRDTFELMYQWIMKRRGALCGVSKDGKFIGFSYVCLYKDSACYASACDDPEFVTNVPISHAAQWAIITWLKEQGFKSYEIGPQQFGPQIYEIPSAKDLSISFFKRGFGGRTITCYRGVKYYDKEVMQKELDDNMRKLEGNYILADGAGKR